MAAVINADKRDFPVAADHGNEHRDNACHNDHDESVTGQRAILHPGRRGRDRAQRNCISCGKRRGAGAAARAGQQRTRSQQAEKARTVSQENPRYRDSGVQQEDQHQPN